MENQALYQVSEITLAYTPKIKPRERPKVSTSKEAYQVFLSVWDKGKIEFIEEFKVLLLNNHKRVLGVFTVTIGGHTQCFVDARLVFTSALLSCATSVILAHNHPSGNAKPSANDLHITKKLSEVGKLLDIPVIDHIIVTLDSYYSFGDEGII